MKVWSEDDSEDKSKGEDRLRGRTIVMKPKDNQAELDAAEKTVREAGGVPTELLYRASGQMQVSFKIPGHGEHTFLWDKEESLTTLYDFVRSKIPRVIAVPRK